MGKRMTSSRPLVFLHLHKTGGTSLINWIQRHIPPAATLWAASSWRDLSRVSDGDARRKSFIRGHFGASILDWLDAPAFAFALLRDPVARVVSHYVHSLHDPEDVDHQIVAGERMTLAQYVRDGRFQHIVDNYQTAQLGLRIKPCSYLILLARENWSRCGTWTTRRDARHFRALSKPWRI